jgi:hypothetical protein
MKGQYNYSSIEDSEVVLIFERNDVGSKKLSQVLSEQTRDPSAFLNVMCLLKYVLNCGSIFHISIRIKCNRISESFLYWVFGLRPSSYVLSRTLDVPLHNTRRWTTFKGTVSRVTYTVVPLWKVAYL